MKMTKDMLATITKGNSYAINPNEIVIDKDLNPRKDYGAPDEWASFKNSIKDYGVQQNIKVYFDEENKNFHLVHGFRRMQAIKELLEEDPELASIQSVTIDIVENNIEEAIVSHFILNSGKPLNDVEMADGILHLQKQSGETSIPELARRVGIPYPKVNALLKFSKHAGVKIKNEVIRGELSFNAAKSIVNKSKSITDQNHTLEIAKEKAAQNGSKKVLSSALPYDENKANFETRVGNYIAELSGIEEVNQEGLNMFKAVIKAIKKDTPIEELIPIFNIQMENA